MRLIKMFGLAIVVAVAAMAFVGATSASAVSTQLCDHHPGLTCDAGHAVSSHHLVLASGTVGELLAAIDVLCLGILILVSAGALGSGAAKQTITSTTQTFSNCGTGSTHSNCTVSTPAQPVFGLLKTGLDAGTLTATSGQVQLVCSNLGLNCLYDAEGMEFTVGGGHLTAEEAGVNELGGKFLCPDEGLLDGLLEVLGNVYALG